MNTMNDIIKVWTHLRRQQHFRGSKHQENEWARRFYVQARALHELDEMVRDLNRRLASLGMEAPEGRSAWGKHELPLVYKVL